MSVKLIIHIEDKTKVIDTKYLSIEKILNLSNTKIKKLPMSNTNAK